MRIPALNKQIKEIRFSNVQHLGAMDQFAWPTVRNLTSRLVRWLVKDWTKRLMKSLVRRLVRRPAKSLARTRVKPVQMAQLEAMKCSASRLHCVQLAGLSAGPVIAAVIKWRVAGQKRPSVHWTSREVQQTRPPTRFSMLSQYGCWHKANRPMTCPN